MYIYQWDIWREGRVMRRQGAPFSGLDPVKLAPAGLRETRWMRQKMLRTCRAPAIQYIVNRHRVACERTKSVGGIRLVMFGGAPEQDYEHD